MGDDLDEDFLRGILGVGGVREHPHGQPIERALQGAHQHGQRRAVSMPRGAHLFRVKKDHASSLSRSDTSSLDRVFFCSSKAPSSISSGTGGAISTKE